MNRCHVCGALAAKDAELERLKAKVEAFAEYEGNALNERDEARAQLAEANKALDEIGNGCDGRADRDSLPCRIARRARETHGGENG